MSPIPSLARWGVSARGDLTYRALVMLGAQSIADLRNALGLTIKEVRTAAEELHVLEAIDMVLTARRPDDRLWSARPPTEVVASLRDRKATQALVRSRLNRMPSFLDIVDAPLDQLAYVRPIYSVPAAKMRYAELVAHERFEHLAMNPESAFSASTARSSISAFRSTLVRGVHTMSLGVPTEVEDESETYAAELYAFDGLEYRELPQQPIKVAVMDRATAFIPLNPEMNFNSGVLEVSSPALVAQIVSFFMRHWDRANPPIAGWQPPEQLDSRERAVLLMLATCANDDVVAERLGLSRRTIGYTVKALLDRYGVQNRFQLGLVLGNPGGKKKISGPQ